MAASLLSSTIQTRYAPSSDGYVRVRLDDGSITEEHRFVLARALGRELEAGEIVRHINGDRADNDVANLMLDERGEGERGGRRVSLVCAECGQPFTRDTKMVRLSMKRKQKHFFCGRACVGRAFGRGKKG